MRRCPWARNPLAIRYHDREWGVPVHSDRVFFEFLILAVRKAFGTFSAYVWAFVGGRPSRLKPGARVPARTGLSDALSKDLQRRGFRFVGTTIIYAFMQATGLVNDHVRGCFCLKKK